ncbi:hypothetical protein OG863_11225 [Streptomyces decoyicus]|uniref:DUF6875 domain-containing protein n=1 Tax=Streptomyces decoyicus TaxID=249567 RepID=A0ABZ1FDQ7_9ACTN|nr:hypothetical protein [Streptomyces decoyicus]WSB68482.1 hypothetical protein OG863_11225 [Streptomyces decoyicus]
MYLSHDDPSDIVLESHGQGDMQILTEIAHWLRSFLTHAHPDLGRKGAVCPFMEQSLKLGRTALSSVDISGPRGTGRLANTARSALARLGDRSAPDSVYNAFVMVPVGESAEVRRERILEVQQELKAEAVEAGKMVGEFYPGHPMPGIHSETFRPLVSPHPVLAVRAMVVTDILFLTFPAIPAEERLAYLRVWHGLFGEGTAGPWGQIYEKARAEAEREASEYA